MPCKECGGTGGQHKHGCGMSPAVLQINNKSCTLFHNVTIPAIMGDETEVPPTNGLYKNVLLYYEASGNAYFYSSDGIPTKLTYATTNYSALTNKPSINGIILEGAQSSDSLGIVVPEPPTPFTMQYENLDGWGFGEDSELIRTTSGSSPKSIYRGTIHLSDADTVSFRNETTGATLSPQEFYELLLGGADVVLNHVPLGWSGLAEEPHAFVHGYVNGIKLNNGEIAMPLDENVTSFNGSAYLETAVYLYYQEDEYYSGWVFERVCGTLGISISGYAEGDGTPSFDTILLDGYVAR